MSKSDLDKARKNKNDEFYTQYSDIDNELKHYTKHFNNAHIYCNCDNPSFSQFYVWFLQNFNRFKLKQVSFTFLSKKAYRLDIIRDNDTFIVNKTMLEGNGDFRSDECVEILKQADIIITNPPFSLFREYVAQLMEYDKKFLILGTVDALTYKEIFPLIKDDKIWLGVSIHSGDREFAVPDDYEIRTNNSRVGEDGTKYVRVPSIRWFTNLDYPQRHEIFETYYKYNPEDYPKYDNYDAIDVDKTKKIPCDYTGVMGVPITFIDKYNPDQFEIIGICEANGVGMSGGIHHEGTGKHTLVNGVKTYSRMFVRWKQLPKH